MDRKSALLAQVFMTFFMAATMSGPLGLVAAGGPSGAWLTAWPRQFLLAWPIAFGLTMVAWPASTALSRTVLRGRRREAGAGS